MLNASVIKNPSQILALTFGIKEKSNAIPILDSENQNMAMIATLTSSMENTALKRFVWI